MAKFRHCREAEEIGRQLILDFHEHLSINAVRVEFLARDDVPRKNGKPVLAEVKKISGLNAFLPTLDRLQNTGEEKDPEEFFVIIVSGPSWERLELSEKRALLDHELMHCWCEDFGDGLKLSLVAHDFEGFRAEIERHGLWRNDAELMAKTMRGQEKQMALPLDEISASRRRRLLRDEGADTITLSNGQRSVTVTPGELKRAADLLETETYSGKLAAAGPDPDDPFETLANAVTHAALDIVEGGSRRR